MKLGKPLEITMKKASFEQYDAAVEQYEQGGPSAVFAFAEREGITAFADCHACECVTPRCLDDTCLVCGSCNLDDGLGE